MLYEVITGQEKPQGDEGHADGETPDGIGRRLSVVRGPQEVHRFKAEGGEGREAPEKTRDNEDPRAVWGGAGDKQAVEKADRETSQGA